MIRYRFPFVMLRGPATLMLLGFFLTATAQDDLFITVSAPAAGAAAPAQESDLFTTVSGAAGQPAAAVQPAAKPAALPAVQQAARVATPAVPQKESSENWEQELLRDPFWPIGFFPEGWQTKTPAQGGSALDGSGWKAAAAKIRISGTSRLGGRTAAIVNGELKGIGEQIEVSHEGKTYQWQIAGIDSEGRIQLKKQGIK